MDDMTPFLHGGEVPIEDRIEQLARLALVQSSANPGGDSLQMMRSERRANAI